MKVVVVGLGIQGKKRRLVAGQDVVATVDPVNPEADRRDLREVPLASYDAALVCTPDQVKIGLLEYLLTNRKHVLLEKPLISDHDDDLLKLKSLAEKNGVTCYTAYNHRFEPHIIRLRDAIASGQLGKIHSASFFYGNGTARDVRNSAWRDQGMGLIPDLGSHLIDTCLFLFGELKGDFEPLRIDRFENLSPDHVLFSNHLRDRGAPAITCEATLLSWRNTFRADVIGEAGSAHIDCLCKWGPSVFTLRKRILPSGRPTEEVVRLESKDPTWEAEYAWFKEICARGHFTNIDNDLYMNGVFRDLWKKWGER